MYKFIPLFLFLFSNLAYSQQTHQRLNRGLNQDSELCANVSGTDKCITIDGSSGVTRVPSGINFNASGGDTLSDYDEGSFTPSLSSDQAGQPTVGYDLQEGRYVRNGNKVDFALVVDANSYTGAAGNLRVTLTGMPCLVESGASAFNLRYAFTFNWSGFTMPTASGGTVDVQTEMINQGGLVQIFLGSKGASGSTANLQANDGTLDGDEVIRINGTYMCDH